MKPKLAPFLVPICDRMLKEIVIKKIVKAGEQDEQ